MSCGCDVFVVRQWILEIAVCMTSFSVGLGFAFPAVLVPGILDIDADIKATPDQASWIVTCLGIGGLGSYCFLPTVFEIFGRRKVNVLSSLLVLIGNVVIYFASNIYFLAIGRFLQGILIGGSIISLIALCECVSPKRRGYFTVLNKVYVALGSLACHTLIFFLNWRQIALVGALANLISIIIFATSAESPLFFAMRGQFDKCKDTFKWYRGDTLNSRKELKEVISAQTEILRIKEREKNINNFKKIKTILLTKEFRKSFYIVTLATLCLDSCGRYFVLTYITQILTELMKNSTLAIYMSIATDAMLIFALCISTVIVKHFKRRTLLFNLGYFAVFLMFMVSFSIILKSKFHLLQDVKWFTSAIILLHTFVTNLSLIPITFALIGEVFSLDHKGVGSFMSGVVYLVFLNVVIKATPIMIDKTGIEGTYFIYGLCLFVFLVLLQLVLPETKDKTLQQIEDEIKGIVRNSSETELIKLSGVKKC